VRDAINIPEEVFGKALNEFVNPRTHDCVEVGNIKGRLRLGKSNNTLFPLSGTARRRKPPVRKTGVIESV
jgi:hypothetical protein